LIYPQISAKLNYQQERLVFRLKEGDLSLTRFLKVGSGKLIPTPKHPEGEYLDKAAFETDFQNKLYGPNDLETYPRWGIIGKENLVLLDFDKQTIYDIMKTRLPQTLEVKSPKRGLPHYYLIVCGKQVPNLKFHVPGDTYVNAKGATVKNPSGEIRADNHYLVAPGTTIRYEDTNGIWLTGEYTITNDVPIARLEYDEFMKAVQGYLMEAAGERILTDEKLFNGVSEGERHDTVFRYACRLIGDNPEGGFPALLALEMLERYNNEKLFDKAGNHAPVEKDFLIRVIKEALEKASKSSEIPAAKIAELGFTTIKERENQGENLQSKDGILAPEERLDVSNDKLNEYLAKRYEVSKQYETHAILVKKALTTNTETQQENDGPRLSQADRLYKLVLAQNLEFFHDQNKTEFARIPIENNATNAINDTSNIHSAEDEIKGDNSTAIIVCKNAVNTVNSVSVDEKAEFLKKLREAKDDDEIDTIVNENRQKQQAKRSYETVRLKDEKFKTYLSRLLYEAEEKVLNHESASQVITLLKYNASHGKCYNLYNRAAPDPNGSGIWLDMADLLNRAYHITKDGWTLENNVPILFRRYEHQRPLAVAVKEGNARTLLEYIKISPDKKADDAKSKTAKHRELLLLVQTASYLIPEIAHPVNAMFGCPGSHKSTAQRFIREIFDPSAATLLRIPRDENAALQVLDHHYIPIFDNLDYLPRWFSDMLCGAVTGAGQESRALYTDEDSFIRSFRRCVMLNGLNLPATKGDLLNRTIMHPTEPSNERRTEAELNKKYKTDLPEILGGFLNLAVKALEIKDAVKPVRLFRLADFTEWGAALANALGEADNEFIDAMEENLASQNEADIENNVVADAFLTEFNSTTKLEYALAIEGAEIKGTPDAIYRLISDKAANMGINTKGKKWPQAAQSFTRKLNDSKSAIIASGWNYEMVHDGKQRFMVIWRNEKGKLHDDGKPKFIYETVSSADKCDCGNFAVTKLTITPTKGKLRQCEECFAKLKADFQQGANFVPKEVS